MLEQASLESTFCRRQAQPVGSAVRTILVDTLPDETVRTADPTNLVELARQRAKPTREPKNLMCDARAHALWTQRREMTGDASR